MNLKEVMAALKAKGSEQIRRILMRHGAPDSLLGVRIGDMKPIAKRIKGDQTLAMELYGTGIGDAQYLAGMVADGRKMSAQDLQGWADHAAWDMISGYTVAWVASEHPAGFKLGVKWTKSKQEHVMRAGWTTLGAIAATVPDEQLPLAKYGRLLDRAVREIGRAPDGAKYTMNGFVISVGTYVAPLGTKAMEVAKKIGKVEIDMGGTSCTVPVAAEHIVKCRRGAAVAPKRQTVRC